MFTSLIAACRRVFAFVSFIVLGVLRLARWLLSALVGSWQPPLWLRKLWQGLCACGRWLRARPGKTAAGLALLALLGGAGRLLRCTATVTEFLMSGPGGLQFADGGP